MFAQSLLDTHEMYQIAINNLSDGIFLIDQQQCIWLWNGAAERITGYNQEEMIGPVTKLDVLDHIDGTGVPVAAGNNCPVRATFRDGRQRISELFLRHKKGYRVPVLAKTVPIMENGEVIAVVGVFADNTVHVRKNDVVSPINRLVMTDPLTGLSNKRYCEMQLEAHLDDYQRYGVRFGVLSIHFDDYDICSDQYGYEASNHLLIELANRITSTIREGDFIGRWAGEEFIGVFDLRSTDELKPVAEKMRKLVDLTEIDFLGHPVHTTASIGASMANTGDTVQQLTERTSSLMHVSKICGKNCATIG